MNNSDNETNTNKKFKIHRSNSFISDKSVKDNDVVISSSNILELCASKNKIAEEKEEEEEQQQQQQQQGNVTPVALQNEPIIRVIVERFPKLAQQLTILPLYPTDNKMTSERHPLLPNIPLYQLNQTERMRRCSNTFRPSFAVFDNDPSVPSLLRAKYQMFYSDLMKRLKVDFAILDYNYTRLDRYIQRLIEEQIQVFNLRPAEIPRLDEREYPLTLEFFLQFDVNVFYMKTCSFRYARPRSLNEGLFCMQTPEARYELADCGNCGLCYPQYDMSYRTKKCIVEFNPAHKHAFINGYEAILNCSASCHTQNIIYTLTCPCGKVDYIGATHTSLHDRLFTHREHGNRILHEFLLGQDNIGRDLKQRKTDDILRKDRMKLYQHSAHCPAAMQIFLDANPQYWRFVPMTIDEAETLEQKIVAHPQLSDDDSDLSRRSKEKCQICIQAIPRAPSGYMFSNRQVVRQAEYFHQKSDVTLPNYDIDLYHATIVAVLPENCSNTFRYVIESLFITYAETTLNTIGNVLNEEQQRNHYYPLDNPWLLRGSEWCQGLVRRPRPKINKN